MNSIFLSEDVARLLASLDSIHDNEKLRACDSGVAIYLSRIMQDALATQHSKLLIAVLQCLLSLPLSSKQLMVTVIPEILKSMTDNEDQQVRDLVSAVLSVWTQLGLLHEPQLSAYDATPIAFVPKQIPNTIPSRPGTPEPARSVSPPSKQKQVRMWKKKPTPVSSPLRSNTPPQAASPWDDCQTPSHTEPTVLKKSFQSRKHEPVRSPSPSPADSPKKHSTTPSPARSPSPSPIREPSVPRQVTPPQSPTPQPPTPKSPTPKSPSPPSSSPTPPPRKRPVLMLKRDKPRDKVRSRPSEMEEEETIKEKPQVTRRLGLFSSSSSSSRRRRRRITSNDDDPFADDAPAQAERPKSKSPSPVLEADTNQTAEVSVVEAAAEEEPVTKKIVSDDDEYKPESDSDSDVIIERMVLNKRRRQSKFDTPTTPSTPSTARLFDNDGSVKKANPKMTAIPRKKRATPAKSPEPEVSRESSEPANDTFLPFMKLPKQEMIECPFEQAPVPENPYESGDSENVAESWIERCSVVGANSVYRHFDALNTKRKREQRMRDEGREMSPYIQPPVDYEPILKGSLLDEKTIEKIAGLRENKGVCHFANNRYLGCLKDDCTFRHRPFTDHERVVIAEGVPFSTHQGRGDNILPLAMVERTEERLKRIERLSKGTPVMSQFELSQMRFEAENKEKEAAILYGVELQRRIDIKKAMDIVAEIEENVAKRISNDDIEVPSLKLLQVDEATLSTQSDKKTPSKLFANFGAPFSTFGQDGEGEESGSENDAPKSMLSFSFGTSFLDKEKSPTPEPESDGEPKVAKGLFSEKKSEEPQVKDDDYMETENEPETAEPFMDKREEIAKRFLSEDLTHKPEKVASYGDEVGNPPCKYFFGPINTCTYGKLCRFAHTEDNLGMDSLNPVKDPPNKALDYSSDVKFNVLPDHLSSSLESLFFCKVDMIYSVGQGSFVVQLDSIEGVQAALNYPNPEIDGDAIKIHVAPSFEPVLES